MFRDKEAPTASAVQREEAVVQPGSDYEAALRELVRKEIASKGALDNDANAVLRYSTPFYFRELIVYPDGPDQFTLQIRETDSKTKPYAAEVKASMVRYSTKLSRDRSTAASDTNFYRSTGEETTAYALSNGRWVRSGALFVAGKVEEKINGEWVPIQEEVQRAMNKEPEEKGFLGKVWSSVFGG